MSDANNVLALIATLEKLLTECRVARDDMSAERSGLLKLICESNDAELLKRVSVFYERRSAAPPADWKFGPMQGSA